MTSTVVLADLWCVAGRPSRARRLYEDALQRAEAHGEIVTRATVDLHVGLAEIDLEAGNLTSAREHLHAALAPGERPGMEEGRHRWFIAMGLLAKADGDPEEALRFLERAAELYRPGFFPDVRPIAAIKTRIWIAQGNLSAAGEWARERGVRLTDEARYLSEFDHLTLVRLVLARHREAADTGLLAEASGLLDRLYEAAEASERASSLLEIGLLQAQVHEAEGHHRQALEVLARVLARAPEPEGYVRLLVDEGALVLSLLRHIADDAATAGATDQPVARERARSLLRLASAPASPTPDSSQRQAARSAVPLSDRELQVLRLLDSELTGPEIARELFVSHNTLRTHTKHIFTKLEVSNRRAAVLRGRERGLT